MSLYIWVGSLIQITLTQIPPCLAKMRKSIPRACKPNSNKPPSAKSKEEAETSSRWKNYEPRRGGKMVLSSTPIMAQEEKVSVPPIIAVSLLKCHPFPKTTPPWPPVTRIAKLFHC